VTVEIVYETHSTTTDNEAGIASGWSEPSLSDTGRAQARELGERRRGDGTACVYCSDLKRAVETAEIAFGASFRTDKRLRECDYGKLTRAPSKQIDAEWPKRVDEPFPGGESVRQVAQRMQSFIDDVASEWDGRKIVVIGHRATKLALDHLLGDLSLEEAVAAPFVWQPGWSYTL
jgi:broad specificity phosphatase PhoE